MSRAVLLAPLFFYCGLGALGCNKQKETTSKDKPRATEGFELEFKPSDEPPTLLSPDECEVRTEETEAFTLFYRHERLALKVRKNSDLPMCYLYGPEAIFATVVLNKPESPSISTEHGVDLHIIIETLPDKSLSLVAMDGNPNGFFESYILTSSTVSLIDAVEYANEVNELRTLTSAFQLHIKKQDQN